jgi:Cytochrome P450
MDGANVRFCVSRGGFIGTTVSPCARPRSTLRRLSEQIGRYAYLPFGAGPRICIGAAFALQEATLVLAAIAKNFRLLLAPGATVWPLQRVTLRSMGGLPMVLARDALRAEVKPRHGSRLLPWARLMNRLVAVTRFPPRCRPLLRLPVRPKNGSAPTFGGTCRRQIIVPMPTKVTGQRNSWVHGRLTG